MIVTRKYRIKDSTSRKRLIALAKSVNSVWNHCNSAQVVLTREVETGSTSKRTLSAFDLQKLTVGWNKRVNLNSASIQVVCHKYASNLETSKKNRLKWRNERSLGWVPFRGDCVKVRGDEVTFMKKKYRFWAGKGKKGKRPVPQGAKIKCGSFHQDARGRWYINLTFDNGVTGAVHPHLNDSIGIDLGVKDAVALSTGQKYGSDEARIAELDRKLRRAQRAGKRRLVRTLHAKIVNTREDDIHKATTQIARRFGQVYVGDVRSKEIIEKAFTKTLRRGVYHACWYKVKSYLRYKVIGLGGKFCLVPEHYTTQTCSTCATRTGPKGKEGLGVRAWTCTVCNVAHDRDTNAAQNILIRGLSQKTENGVNVTPTVTAKRKASQRPGRRSPMKAQVKLPVSEGILTL